MNDKKIDWRDLVRMLGGDARYLRDSQGESALVVSKFIPDEGNEQLRDFIVEVGGRIFRAETVEYQGFKMPGNDTIH